jgi:peptidoglycan hydrolase CwlO-like protein
MSRLYAVLALGLVCAANLSADPVSTSGPPDDNWNSIITDLQSVSDDLADNQKQIDDLHTKIAELQTLGKDSAAEIARLQTLVDQHAARVKELGERYTKVLTLAQRLKGEVERATLFNYIFGGVAVAAVIVAVGEGVVLAHR